MFIETTYMRYGHGPSGIIGKTLQPAQLKKWANGLHICTNLIRDMKHLDSDVVQNSAHKEEMPFRIRNNREDRLKIKIKLSSCIDPWCPEDQGDDLVNIVNGKIACKKVNVDRALEIGTEQCEKFLKGWPNSFHKPLEKRVITMIASRKQEKVGSEPILDTTLIYSRILC